MVWSLWFMVASFRLVWAHEALGWLWCFFSVYTLGQICLLNDAEFPIWAQEEIWLLVELRWLFFLLFDSVFNFILLDNYILACFPIVCSSSFFFHGSKLLSDSRHYYLVLPTIVLNSQLLLWSTSTSRGLLFFLTHSF